MLDHRQVVVHQIHTKLYKHLPEAKTQTAANDSDSFADKPKLLAHVETQPFHLTH